MLWKDIELESSECQACALNTVLFPGSPETLLTMTLEFHKQVNKIKRSGKQGTHNEHSLPVQDGSNLGHCHRKELGSCCN